MLSLSRSAVATAAALLLVSEGVVAHMALSKPPPLRSTLNKQYDSSSFDYSMTAPLALDGRCALDILTVSSGRLRLRKRDSKLTSLLCLLVSCSNFPCKGYASDVPGVSTSVETLKAGSSFTATFAPGGAKHEGGSCQFALS